MRESMPETGAVFTGYAVPTRADWDRHRVRIEAVWLSVYAVSEIIRAAF